MKLQQSMQVMLIAVTAGWMGEIAFSQTYAQDVALAIARDSFRAAYRGAHDFIQTCFEQKFECTLSVREERLLRAIDRELMKPADALQPSAQLIFLSGQENPGFFHLDGEVRLAKTGSRPGDDIYVNDDLIITPSPVAGQFFPFFPDDAVVSVIHEVGHHHHDAVATLPTHEEFDNLGIKIREVMIARRERLTVAIDPSIGSSSSQIVLSSYQSELGMVHGSSRSLLQLVGPFGTYDMEKQLLPSVDCPEIYYKGRLDFQGEAFASSLRFSDMDLEVGAAGWELRIELPRAGFFCLSSLHDFKYVFFDGYDDGVIAIPTFQDAAGFWLLGDRLNFQSKRPPDIHFY